MSLENQEKKHQVEQNKFYKTLYWLLFIAAIVLFWISLRTDTQEVEYTFAAIVVWGLAFLVNRYYLKKE